MSQHDARIWTEGFHAGRASAYLGRYGQFDTRTLMFRRVRNPYEERVCPECNRPGWDGNNWQTGHSLYCRTCGFLSVEGEAFLAKERERK